MQTVRINIGTTLHKSHNKKTCSKCNNKYDKINVELQNVVNGSIVWKKEMISYCRNCKKFYFHDDSDEFIYKHPGYFDYKLAKHIKEKLEINKEKNCLKEDRHETEEEKKEIEKLLPKADFFVRTGINRCSKKKHKIIDLIAEVDVICPNGNIIRKSFPASYCEECKLFFMYDNDYKRIRKSGIPLCSIYEYSKYIIINKNKQINLKPESLLHSFGYNVGETENLSSIQRRKVLSFVINKGIMSKHEIISLLNYFVEFRKNDNRQAKAISKWKMDIDYLQKTNIETSKKVEVNSIRIINFINK